MSAQIYFQNESHTDVFDITWLTPRQCLWAFQPSHVEICYPHQQTCLANGEKATTQIGEAKERKRERGRYNALLALLSMLHGSTVALSDCHLLSCQSPSPASYSCFGPDYRLWVCNLPIIHWDSEQRSAVGSLYFGLRLIKLQNIYIKCGGTDEKMRIQLVHFTLGDNNICQMSQSIVDATSSEQMEFPLQKTRHHSWVGLRVAPLKGIPLSISQSEDSTKRETAIGCLSWHDSFPGPSNLGRMCLQYTLQFLHQYVYLSVQCSLKIRIHPSDIAAGQGWRSGPSLIRYVRTNNIALQCNSITQGKMYGSQPHTLKLGVLSPSPDYEKTSVFPKSN